MSTKWLPAEMPDQSGRIAVVTGANSGLGRIVARELAARGANLVLACRNEAKGRSTAKEIKAARPAAKIEVAALDLADLSSVRSFSERFRAGHDRLDLLVNNAGIMAAPYARTADGFELQLGTNHLGHFALTGLLLGALKEQPGARVVTVSSMAHLGGLIEFSDLTGERHYSRWRAYAQSKLANLLFAFELARRLEAARSNAASVAAHPGWAATNLQFNAPPPHERLLLRFVLNPLIAQSEEMGALPILYAATMPGVASGSFIGPDRLGGFRGYPTPVRASASANNPELARRLWQVSEELTGVRYDLPSAKAA